MLEVKGLVSVSIPFYNQQRFLSEAIESVLSQTYTQWELFLVDDGSDDRSTGIAREYAARFPEKITYLDQPDHRNCGVNCARNLGARSSRGEYLAFLDSDDVWLPHKLELHVAQLDAHPSAGLLYGLSEYWYDWDAHREIDRENHVPALAPAGKMYPPPSLLASSYPLGSYGAPCPSSLLVRRTGFDHIGGFDECFHPLTHQMFEDIAFLAKMYLNLPVFVSGSCLDKYRCHRLSMSQRLQGTSAEESARRYYFRWLRRYLHGQHIADRNLWRAVHREGWVYWLPIPASAAKLLRRISNRLLRCIAPAPIHSIHVHDQE